MGQVRLSTAGFITSISAFYGDLGVRTILQGDGYGSRPSRVLQCGYESCGTDDCKLVITYSKNEAPFALPAPNNRVLKKDERAVLDSSGSSLPLPPS